MLLRSATGTRVTVALGGLHSAGVDLAMALGLRRKRDTGGGRSDLKSMATLLGNRGPGQANSMFGSASLGWAC